MSSTNVRVPIETHYAIERFLYMEADLLDRRRYREWLDLLALDVQYLVPTRYNRMSSASNEQWDPDEEIDTLPLVEEDHQSLTLRIERFFLGSAWSEIPPSRTRHLVTNVIVEAHEGAGDAESFMVRSNFLVYRSRLSGRRGENEDFIVGSRRDVIRRSGEDFRIANRVAIIDSVVLNTHNLSFFL
ncbi:aromatic-ring-hydroxylating dioxygenase subunit beta [Pseudonocardia sp. Cha107L01]|uniref:aromatic-ring-hydroxylating dioxygenase subunit beta n=1 Tax=Pseudonocardia sp. Cha107L01 TaxID=3457576 RepID=UPI00403EC1B6